ncbi:MAG: M56 family metallopeptidase [Cyanophyceae cyanobacterium]
MHLSLMAIAIAGALLFRLTWTKTRNWQQRWQRALGAFVIPPLLLLTSSLAVLFMGTQGTMLGLKVGNGGYFIAGSFLSFAGGMLLHLGGQGWRSLQQVQNFAWVEVQGSRGRLLNSDSLFAAQIGFWHSELVISQGLLRSFDSAHLGAVIAHEQAHSHYRDTFWFFWLGWCRRLSALLPQTEPLWQELLLLRELRADRRAAQQVDSLLLAESLLLMVKAPLVESGLATCSAAAASTSRLEERIEALLSPEEITPKRQLWWLVGLLPLLTMLLHR